jgi:hypothetical protein
MVVIVFDMGLTPGWYRTDGVSIEAKSEATFLEGIRNRRTLDQSFRKLNI